jgi:eukaryotic-like serine/threonine-protein kinase
VLDAAGGTPRAISPHGYRAGLRCISPDSRVAFVTGPDQRWYLFPLGGGEPEPLQSAAPDDSVIGWTPDGKHLYVSKRGTYPARVERLELATGKRELWKELTPPDPAGISNVSPPAIAQDGKTYAYSYNRILSDLFLADGVK